MTFAGWRTEEAAAAAACAAHRAAESAARAAKQAATAARKTKGLVHLAVVPEHDGNDRIDGGQAALSAFVRPCVGTSGALEEDFNRVVWPLLMARGWVFIKGRGLETWLYVYDGKEYTEEQACQEYLKLNGSAPPAAAASGARSSAVVARNGHPQSRASRRTSSRGVLKCPSGRFSALVTTDTRCRSTGAFESEAEAARAYEDTLSFQLPAEACKRAAGNSSNGGAVDDSHGRRAVGKTAAVEPGAGEPKGKRKAAEELGSKEEANKGKMQRESRRVAAGCWPACDTQ
jgi:hypothetical protein